jgi:hypothetical protein
MVIEHTAERITAVAQQMPPVGDLNGLRRSLAGSLGVGAGTIADDDLDRRMVLEPRGQGLGRAIGQQVDPAPALEITEDRAVVAALAPSPVIDPEHTRRERRLEIGLADAAQQGRRTDRHAGPGCQTRSRIAAQRQSDGMMRGAQAVGMAGSATGDVRQRLAERASRAGVIDASKAPDLHAEDDRASKTRQITQATPVMTMDTPGFRPATGAGCRCSRQPGAQGYAMI